MASIRAFLWRHPLGAWTADSFRLDVPCHFCRAINPVGRECYPPLKARKRGWYGLCESCFLRARISQGRRKAIAR